LGKGRESRCCYHQKTRRSATPAHARAVGAEYALGWTMHQGQLRSFQRNVDIGRSRKRKRTTIINALTATAIATIIVLTMSSPVFPREIPRALSTTYSGTRVTSDAVSQRAAPVHGSSLGSGRCANLVSHGLIFIARCAKHTISATRAVFDRKSFQVSTLSRSIPLDPVISRIFPGAQTNWCMTDIVL
jgi:hypothetical protein